MVAMGAFTSTNNLCGKSAKSALCPPFILAGKGKEEEKSSL